MARRSLLKPILLAGFVAGTLDILDVIIFFKLRSHVPPIRILQSVATGLLGRSAYTGGTPSALLGLAMHFCIATFWAALFILIAQSVPVMRRQAIASGLIYGLIIYAVMTFLVLPQTRASSSPGHVPVVIFNAICAIVFLVGLPISLINKNFA
jgi:hypothetical protein